MDLVTLLLSFYLENNNTELYLPSVPELEPKLWCYPSSPMFSAYLCWSSSDSETFL